jgi:hypothetical protein
VQPKTSGRGAHVPEGVSSSKTWPRFNQHGAGREKGRKGDLCMNEGIEKEIEVGREGRREGGGESV